MRNCRNCKHNETPLANVNCCEAIYRELRNENLSILDSKFGNLVVPNNFNCSLWKEADTKPCQLCGLLRDPAVFLGAPLPLCVPCSLDGARKLLKAIKDRQGNPFLVTELMETITKESEVSHE